MGFALFCERVVPGVVVCNMGVKHHFVPFLRMFSFDKAKGRSDRVGNFEYSIRKTRVLILPED